MRESGMVQEQVEGEVEHAHMHAPEAYVQPTQHIVVIL